MMSSSSVGLLGSVLFLILLFSHSAWSAKSKYVKAALNTRWRDTPILLETSEFLASEGNQYFWQFVDKLTELGGETSHDQETYNLALKLATQSGLSGLQISLLKFSLSLRAHSPTVQMFNQMALDLNPPAECEAFVNVHGMVTCDIDAMGAFIKAAQDSSAPALIRSDHHYPGGADQRPHVILYAQIATPTFKKFHTKLRALSGEGKVDYILRHFTKVLPEEPVRLSGYGVELAIKKTEYKAKDDRKVEGDNAAADDEDDDDELEGFAFKQLKELHPDSVADLDKFKQHLEDSTGEMAELKVWQLQDLSFQAAQRVISAPPGEQLQTLRDISQNFPVMANALSATTVDSKTRREIQKNQRYFEQSFGLSAGESAFFMNGLQADLDTYDVFTLLDQMKSEAKLMDGLHTMGIKGADLSRMMKLDFQDSESYAVDIRDPAVTYINNLEVDKRYFNWPSSVQDILRPTFPGMLRHVRKNFFQIVFMVNPGDIKKSRDLIKTAEAFFVHNAPVRIGIVFVLGEVSAPQEDDPGVCLCRAFSYLTEADGPTKALSFITDVYEQSPEDIIHKAVILREFATAYPNVDVAEVFGEDSQHDGWCQSGSAMLERMGLGSTPQVLINGVPLKAAELDPETFEEAVVSTILKQTPEIQKAVYDGKLSEGMDILDFIMTRKSVMPRLNARILSTTSRYLDLTHDVEDSLVKSVEKFNSAQPHEQAAGLRASLKYMAKKEDGSTPVSVWVVADLETARGRDILYQALRAAKGSNQVRVAVIHNPSTVAESKEAAFISVAVEAALHSQTSNIARMFVTKLANKEYASAIQEGKKTLEDLSVNKMDMDAFHAAREEISTTFLQLHSTFAKKVLNFKPGEQGVVANGRVLGPLAEDEHFIQEDFALLEKYTLKQSAEKIHTKVEKLSGMDTSNAISEAVMRVSSLLMSEPRSETRKEVEYHGDQVSVVNLPARDPNSPAYELVAIVDPATRAAQKYTPLLMVLYEVANVNVKVFMNCREKLSEMPLKSFYRFVLEPELQFSVDSSLTSGPTADFRNMPIKPILTLGMDPPESWLVECTSSVYDLDNIHLEEVESAGIQAEFELEHLLLEGHCYDSTTGQPPRGLQFVLGTNSTPALVDTIVMANLGYFQLKASPGAWILNLRDGRSNDIYEVTNHDKTDSPPDSKEVISVIDSFKSKIIKIRVTKKLGQENEDLLGEDEEMGGLWSSISRSFSGGAKEKTKENSDQTLNIFSVASGHLYERLTRIMMLSVLRNTKTPVKFWLLKNYLSPSFKDIIPAMAEEYGFEYELIQYKWPRWLHQQTEKQRTIWGYKILFLDVLFPLDVNKIIFVDADQIVRADLQELLDIDMEGAPYAYTPFCDSRTEMDGFRFWKSGYWASHLAGRRYHISALYVVDLKRFRRVAAGDRLRGQYQGLSQDPNSLSNLDQDLPNNMIHQVAIKSLPQEWLWCETWCDDRSKASAKTIDMCNNPLTKEPKLTAAARIAPEWTAYDEEQRQFWNKYYSITSSSKKDKTRESKKDTPESTEHTEL